MGLALGLAQAVYGESALDDEAVTDPDPTPAQPTGTMAVDRDALLGD